MSACRFTTFKESPSRTTSAATFPSFMSSIKLVKVRRPCREKSYSRPTSIINNCQYACKGVIVVAVVVVVVFDLYSTSRRASNSQIMIACKRSRKSQNLGLYIQDAAKRVIFTFQVHQLNFFVGDAPQFPLGNTALPRTVYS